MMLLIGSLILFVVLALLWRGLASDEGKENQGKADTSKLEWPMRRAMPEALTEFGEEVAPRRRTGPEGRSAASAAEGSTADTESQDMQRLQAVPASSGSVLMQGVEVSQELASARKRPSEQPQLKSHRAEASRELSPARPPEGAMTASASPVAVNQTAQQDEAAPAPAAAADSVRRGDEAAVAVRALAEGGKPDDGWQAAYSSDAPFHEDGAIAAEAESTAAGQAAEGQAIEGQVIAEEAAQINETP